MQLLAPAKINLHLRVGPRRNDGFHSLLSWMCTVGLFDSLELEALPHARPAESPVTLSCDLPELPCDSTNLVVRVATAWLDLMRQERSLPIRYEAIRAMLSKRIPMGGGLGGGSSDGAAALIGLNSLWDAGWDATRLGQFAAAFGSDLPFFFHGPSSVCSGRGEFVRPIDPPKPLSALLLLPSIAMPTGSVYRRFDEMGLGREEDLHAEPDWSVWTRMDARELLPCLANDLERPAFDFSPELRWLRGQSERLLGRPVRMSGSGSSLFTIFDTSAESTEAANRLTGQIDMRVLSVPLAPMIKKR